MAQIWKQVDIFSPSAAQKQKVPWFDAIGLSRFKNTSEHHSLSSYGR
jgi:hypothetical protein